MPNNESGVGSNVGTREPSAVHNVSGVEKKLTSVFEKFGVWCFLSLIAVCIFQFQALESRVKSTEKSVVKLQEVKVSKAELKNMQESILREISGSRDDFKTSIETFRNDMTARLDLVIMNSAKDKK